MSFLNSYRIYVVLFMGALGLLLLIAGCARDNPPASPPGAASRASASLAADANEYLGDAACASCHAKEFREHSGTNHAHTLRVMDRASLGNVAPPTGPLPNMQWILQEGEDGYRVTGPDGGGSGQKIHYAFGSGKHGITYASVLLDNRMMEMRASYFPKEHEWRITPGQEKMTSSRPGYVHTVEKTRKCFVCHTVTLPPDSPTPQTRFVGVGCEACHGAGGAHVAAVQSGSSASDLRIERLGTWGAKRLNEMCGRCHRTAANVKASRPVLMLTARFQPYALMLSRCYLQSNNTLSCTTCHNPHQNTSRDRRAYELACLNCHSGKKTALPGGTLANLSTPEKLTARATPAVSGKTCPVNPKAGCIGCHMPIRNMIPGSGVHSVAPDHYIRIAHPKEEEQEIQDMLDFGAMESATGMSQ